MVPSWTWANTFRPSLRLSPTTFGCTRSRPQALDRRMSSAVSARLRRLVFQRAHGICEYCLIHEEDACFSFHVDHISSRKQKGSTTSDNLALACLRCNVSKGTDPGVIIGRPPRLVRLYHPRQDRWDEHFRIFAARIHPVSEIGEATVSLLDLNAQDRLLLRCALVKAGRYPSANALAYLRA